MFLKIKADLIQDDEAIQIIPEPIKENQNDLPTDNSSPENPQIFPTEGEDIPASMSDDEKGNYNLRPSTHPYYSDKYR